MPRRDLNPQPSAWPQCSECKTAYVLRRALTFSASGRRMSLASEWTWQRDCKHRKAAAEVGSASKRRTEKRSHASRSGNRPATSQRSMSVQRAPSKQSVQKRNGGTR